MTVDACGSVLDGDHVMQISVFQELCNNRCCTVDRFPNFKQFAPLSNKVDCFWERDAFVSDRGCDQLLLSNLGDPRVGICRWMRERNGLGIVRDGILKENHYCRLCRRQKIQLSSDTQDHSIPMSFHDCCSKFVKFTTEVFPIVLRINQPLGQPLEPCDSLKSFLNQSIL